MTRIEILTLLPYLFSLLLSLGITVYTWVHRQVRGAGAYMILTSAQTLTVFGFILELLSPNLNGKLLWDKFQWITFAVEAAAIPSFAILYADYKVPNPKLVWVIASIVPACVPLLITADPWLHVIYPNPSLSQSIVFGELQYKFTWAVYAFAAYGYLATLVAFVLLSRRIVHPHRLYRAQVTTILIGLMIPIFGTSLPLLDIQLTPLRDATPLTSALGNLIVAWGIFRYRWLDIVHIARDKILENMTDLVFVLDAQDRILDINHSALKLLGLGSHQAIGKAATTIFREWPEVLDKFSIPANTNLEAIVDRNEKYYHFDVKSTLLYNQRGDYQGRIFVARDITPYAELQWKLRELNEKLEQRVQQRTEDLEDAYDSTISGWAKALELRDKETEGHSRRVIETTLILAKAMGISSNEFNHIRRGAILHDIGKMAIPDEILKKRGPLTKRERVIVNQHPFIAFQMLSSIKYLEHALEIPYYHHERWDGSGYPQGLKGEDIPLAARIFAVVDVWDALLSDRPYNKAWTQKQAKEYLQAEAGKQFDPEVVSMFLRLVEEGKI